MHNVHFASTKIEACRRAYLGTDTLSRRVRSWRQPGRALQLRGCTLHELPIRRLLHRYIEVCVALSCTLYVVDECVRILGLVDVHAPTLPLHLACMHHLSHLNSKLFILAHDLVEREPENPISWYAVGVWYLSSGKWTEARTYFRYVCLHPSPRFAAEACCVNKSKTSLMDPRFAPAWIAFAHSFAHEGEHDHAITAYSTCTRLFTGSHLPLMFVGMEHISLSNLQMADESFTAANIICDADPLLANEQGVLAFSRGE